MNFYLYMQGSLKLYIQVNHVDPASLSNDSSSLVAEFIVWINATIGENGSAQFDHVPPFYRTDLGSFINLTIELNCEEHYYGAECTRYCEPRNDEIGHYLCDDSGNFICLEGFQNETSNCTECSISDGCRKCQSRLWLPITVVL